MEKPSFSLITKFNSQEAKRFFQKAKIRKKTEGLEILIAPRSFEYGRILVITPRKSGNSPERNKIRRRLKHIFYENKMYENSFDFVVIVSKIAIDLTFDQLKEILISSLNDASKNIKTDSQ